MKKLTNVRTFRSALEERGIETETLTEGTSLLDWAIDDTGEELQSAGIDGIIPRCQVIFCRVDRRGEFRLNNSVALTTDNRLIWIG